MREEEEKLRQLRDQGFLKRKELIELGNELKKTIQLVDVIIINDEEARQLSGTYSLVKAAAIIQAMGPKIVIIKITIYSVL